jgi:hypothetical protein
MIQDKHLEVTDSLTGKTIKMPITLDTINTEDFAQLGLTACDNGYMNTVSLCYKGCMQVIHLIH